MTTSECNFNFGVILTFLSGIWFQLNINERAYKDNFILLLKCLVFQGFPLAVCQHFLMHALLLTKKSGIMTMVGFIGVVFSYFMSIIRYG